MKKFATLMLALVMLISCAAIGMAEDITLDVIICQYGTQTNDWFTGTGMNGTSFVKKFEEANPGIKLNLEVVSWNDVYTVVSTRISNNNAPDILNLDSFADYANEGLLLPVKDYCPEELFNDFFPSFIAQSVIDDTVWAVPDLASARALYYNVDLLEAAGVEVPTTWAAFAYYAWGNGGGFVDDEGNWTINSPENIEAVEFAVNLYKKGYTNPNPATQTRYDLQDMFGAGKLAMVIAPNSLPTYIATKGYTDVNYAVADIPHNEGKTSSSVGVMDRIMAFKDDSAPDQAARNEAIGKFLTFFYDPENYVGWVSMEDFLPAVNSAVAALVEANPSFEAWLKVLDGCKFYPTAKTEWIDVKQGAAAVEQSALTGGDVKTLLDELQAKVKNRQPGWLQTDQGKPMREGGWKIRPPSFRP